MLTSQYKTNGRGAFYLHLNRFDERRTGVKNTISKQRAEKTNCRALYMYNRRRFTYIIGRRIRLFFSFFSLQLIGGRRQTQQISLMRTYFLNYISLSPVYSRSPRVGTRA